MKFYTDISHYTDRKDWINVPHLLRPFFTGAGLDEKMSVYFTDSLNEADYSILPMNLEYYYIRNRIEQMRAFIEDARAAGKPVVVINDGDNSIRKIPDGVIVLSQNVYQSRRTILEFGHPFIVDDPMPEYFHSTTISLRTKGEKPIVGFDGVAGQPLLKVIYHFFVNLFLYVKSLTGLSIYARNIVIPAPVLRKRILALLESDDRICANFIKRKQFRAGAKTPEEQRIKTSEFYRNMLESDYVLCVRGNGNFSKRFYETLSMGRIPVFVNTDCVLPFDNIIDWKKYCIWVEESEVGMIATKVAEFHNMISDQEFQNLQLSCRHLWEEYLNIYGELKNMSNIINSGRL